MRMKPVLFSVVALLAGCATPLGAPLSAPAAREVPAEFQRGAAAGVRYDRRQGQCSAGAVQVLDATRFGELIESVRSTVPKAAAAMCSDVTLARVPDDTPYPSALMDAGIGGSAHVLVLVSETGDALSAHAVCVSDTAFAAPAEAAARSLGYMPARCDEVPRQAAILVPLAYDPGH